MTNEDSAFGPMMMFGVTGPGPKRDRKPIPSDPKKEKGINIKTMNKMKKFLTFEEFVNESNSKTNESIVGALGLLTLYGLTNVGIWAVKNIKYWTSKPGRLFKKLENDKEFFQQLIELLSVDNKDPLKSFREIWGNRREREKFVVDVFELPRAIEFRKQIGLDDEDMYKVKRDFEEAILGAEVSKFLRNKLEKIK
jgi:hypothetical protein